MTRALASVTAKANVLAAEIACCAIPFACVADAVAALSCEAARWDAAAFDAPASGYSTKDEADVAADLKTLLKGSRLAGSREAGGASASAASFADVPAVNGNFRHAVRALDALVRTEPDAGQGKRFLLMQLATRFVTSAHVMCEMSVDRARLCAGIIADAALCEDGVDVGDLAGTLRELTADSYAVAVLGRVQEELLKFRDCLAWEAAVAMAVIEADSSIEKPQASTETEEAAGSLMDRGKTAKTDKKSKKKTLVEGTSSVLMLLRDHATDGKDVPCVHSALVEDWRVKLSSLFDPGCPKFESLVGKLKEIVQSKK